jgi:hypothetical protein
LSNELEQGGLKGISSYVVEELHDGLTPVNRKASHEPKSAMSLIFIGNIGPTNATGGYSSFLPQHVVLLNFQIVNDHSRACPRKRFHALGFFPSYQRLVSFPSVPGTFLIRRNHWSEFQKLDQLRVRVVITLSPGERSEQGHSRRK